MTSVGLRQIAELPIDTVESIPPLPFVGGSYRATKHANGRYTIHDVPIFSEVPEGEKGNEERIDRGWMEKAVAVAVDRYAKNKYLAPVHVKHHGGLDQTQEAGKLRLLRVGEIEYEGKSLAAIYADLVNISAEVFARIVEGGLTYRSVEVFDWATPEINSLALLDTEVPFFRLEMLTVGSVSREFLPVEIHSHPFAHGVLRRDKSRAYLFSFKGGRMADEKPESKDENEKKAAAAPSSEPAKASDGDALKSALEHLLSAVAKIAAKLGVDLKDDASPPKTDEKKDQPGTPVEMPAASSASLASEPMTSSSAVTMRFSSAKRLSSEEAALMGEKAVLAAKLAAADDERASAARVEAALKDLSHFNLGAKVREELAVVLRDGGEGALAAYVGAIKRHSAKMPPPVFTGDVGATAKQIPAAVREYEKHGPDVYARALSAQAEYESFKAAAGDRAAHLSLKEWLAANVAAPSGIGNNGINRR